MIYEFFSSLILPTKTALFYLAISMFILSLFFIRIRLSRIFMLNASILVLMLFPTVIHFSYYPFLFNLGLIFFPITIYFTFLTLYSPEKYKHYLILILVASGLLLVLLLKHGSHPTVSMGLYQIFIFSFIFIFLLQPKKITFFISQKILILLYITLMIFFLFMNNPDYILAGAFFLIFFLLSIINQYGKRFFVMIDQMHLANIQNKKLTHVISRLKTSIEQYKKIISEKDIEIFQISRHASLAEITAGIAHELTQPLTGIKAIAQNMVDDISDNTLVQDNAVDELNKISGLVDKSTKIVNHVRNFQKRSGFSPKHIDTSNAINEAISLLTHQIKQSNISLSVDIAEDIGSIFGETVYIEQLIINIVLNARDAIVEKKQINKDFVGTISVKAVNLNNYVRITISDNGIGIPKEILPKIWNPFFTSKKVIHGTGIGLSICNKIIKEHKGTIKIVSDETGTSFHIDLPAKM
jgi:signal transduction histidine kinase